MKKLKCGISIDMDFFCREKPEWDWGHTEDMALSNDVVWATRAIAGQNIKGITDPNKYADFKPILLPSILETKGFMFTKKTRIGVSWTHRDAYEFFSSTKSNTIFNFDAHHDCGYSWIGNHTYIKGKIIKPEIQCENWAQHLAYQYGKKITVIYPKWKTITSDTMHCLKVTRTKFQSLVKQEYEVEAIFIAQSPAWVPPYIDEYMMLIIEILKRKCGKKLVENGKIMARKGNEFC